MKIRFGLLVTLGWFTLQAQHIRIAGTVLNKKHKPIEQVNVYLEGSFDGALSDAKGYFSFEVEDSLVEGVLKLKHPNYLHLTVPIAIKPNTVHQFVMQEGEELLGEIVIKTEGNDQRRKSEHFVFNAMDVVSTAGSPGNIMGVLNTLPGAQTNGEDGRLLIRGGKAEESGMYVNGIKVFQPYTATVGNVPVRSKFNPFLFKGMSFSAGGYSAEFGDALSGILELDTSNAIDPSRKDSSISTVGVSFAETHQWGKNSLSYHLNYLNLGAYTKVIKQQYTTKKPFATTSGEMVYKREIKEGGYKLYVAVDLSEMEYEQAVKPSQRIDTLSFRSNNVYLNSVYLKKLTPFLKLDIGTGLGYTHYKGNYNEKYMGRKNWDLNQKVKLSYQWNRALHTMVGVDIHRAQLDLTRGIEGYTQDIEADATNTAFFVENNWTIVPDLTLRAGVRVNKYTAIPTWTIEPRTRVTYQLDAKQQLSFSYGIFNQTLALEQALEVKKEDWMQASHYILNYSYTFKKRELRTELFYKTYDKLLLTPVREEKAFTQLGEGYARGLDLFWRDNTTFKNFAYWITYTYLDSKRKEAYWEQSIQPSYVSKHHVAVVTKYWIEKWKSQVSMTYNYSSPRYFYSVDSTNQVRYTTSAIHNVSLSWAYLVSGQKILYASVDNLLGRNPTYAYQFNQIGGQPDLVQASAKRFIYVGFMWTISKDKKSNQLENL
ncbi:TonB-dependent receptor [Myroides fluvii]|uniref:TonB-dependent receptor n=1 Tax=Myroides fluvii TaxID=2572594 RepID=UPI00131C2B96|nr:TonB-dependent receptor [Myroides fluvii]